MGIILSTVAGCCAATACSCCVGLTCNLCGAVFRVQKSAATRVWYAVIFALFALLSWVMSLWAYDLIHWIPWSVIRDNCPKDMCGVYSVYRLSFTLSTFHLFLSALMVGVTSSMDVRAQFQDGWWPIKFLFLIIVSVCSFMIPNSFFDVYAWAAVFGAGLFLLIQLVLLIDFAHSWSESWVARWEEDQENNKAWYYGLLISSGGMYAFVIGLSIAMFVLFSNGNECWYNPLVITINLLFVLTITVCSIHPRVHEFNPRVGLLQSSVISAYCTYLIWSSILSEPTCTGPFTSSDNDSAIGWITVVMGALFTIISVLYASLRAGSSDLTSSPISAESTALAEENGEDGSLEDFDDEKESSSYNYSLFHLAFGLGAMYVGMLLTNWAIIDSSTHSISSDMGWVSVGVKWTCCVTAGVLYLWTVFAPAILSDRDFGFNNY